MGIGALGYAALAATAAGAVANQQAARKVSKAQNAAADWAAMNLDNKNKEQLKLINDFAQETYSAPERLEKYEQTAQEAGDSLASVLTNASSAPTQAAEGNLSQDYLTGKANATTNELNRAVAMARLMGRNRSLSDLNQREQLAGMQNASDVAGLAGDMRRIQRQGDAMMRDASSAGDGMASLGNLLSMTGMVMGGASGAAGALGSGANAAGTAAAQELEHAAGGSMLGAGGLSGLPGLASSTTNQYKARRFMR